MRYKLSIALILLLNVALSACRGVPDPDPMLSPITAATSPLSEATVAISPAETAATAIPATPVRPEATGAAPSKGYGIVIGAVVETTSDAPPTETVMYLGALVGVQDNFPLITVDHQTSPKAIPSTDTGRFVFVDVPPGEYGLVYWTPDGSFLVEDPNQPGITLILTVQPGVTKDIGTLRVPPH